MLTIQTKKLAEAVKACGALAVQKHIPILACVKIEGKGGHLTVDGTDMDTWLSIAVECDGEMPPACIDAQKLRAAVAVGDGGDLTMQLGDSLSLRGEGGSSRIGALKASDFPMPIVSPDAELAFTAKGSALRATFAATVPHVSTMESKRYLCGVHVAAHGAGIRMVGADAPAILTAIVPDAHVERTELAGGIIVPPKSAEIVMRLAADDDDISLSANAFLATFSGNGWRLITRLINEGYPPVDKVIPPRSETWADVDVGELVAALERHAWIAGSTMLTFREGELLVETWNHSSDDDATTSLSADCRGEIAIGVKLPQMVKLLRSLGSEVAGISWTTPDKPLRIDPVGALDGQRVVYMAPMDLIGLPSRLRGEMKHAA